MLEGTRGISLYFSPDPPLGLIPQMVEFVTGYKLFDKSWQVISNVGYLFWGYGVAKSRIELVFTAIKDFWHFSTLSIGITASIYQLSTSRAKGEKGCL